MAYIQTRDVWVRDALYLLGAHCLMFAPLLALASPPLALACLLLGLSCWSVTKNRSWQVCQVQVASAVGSVLLMETRDPGLAREVVAAFNAQRPHSSAQWRALFELP